MFSRLSSPPRSPSLHQNQLHSHQIRTNRLRLWMPNISHSISIQLRVQAHMGTEHGFGLEISGIRQSPWTCTQTLSTPTPVSLSFLSFSLGDTPRSKFPTRLEFYINNSAKIQPGLCDDISGTSLHGAVSSFCVSSPTLLSLRGFAAASVCVLWVSFTHPNLNCCCTKSAGSKTLHFKLYN